MNQKFQKLSPLKSLLFTLIIVLIFFLILEGVVRIYSYIKNREAKTILDTLPMAIPNENRIFELKPNYYQKYKTSEFEIDIRTNSDGLRDGIEHSVSKPKGVYRIIALGDSMTFGWGVNQEDTWWKVLEGELNNDKDSKYQYEVINLGVWMYTYDQQLLRLKDKGLKYQPDLVIQGIYWPHLRTIANHKWEVDNLENIIKISDPTFYISNGGLLKNEDKNAFLNFIKKHSKLLNFVISKFQVLFLKNQLISSDLCLLKQDSEKNYQEAWHKGLESIKQTKETLASLGIDYLVFLIPRDVQVSKEEWVSLFQKTMDEQMYKDEIPQKIFTNFSIAQNIPLIDLLPVFRKKYSGDLYFPLDPHWTKFGHQLAAEQIYSFLKNNFIKK